MHADDDLRHEFQEAVYDGDSDRLRPLCGLLVELHRHHAQRTLRRSQRAARGHLRAGRSRHR